VSGIRLADHRSPLATLNGENSRTKSRMFVKIAALVTRNGLREALLVTSLSKNQFREALYSRWSCGTNTLTVFVDDSLFMSFVQVMLTV
jgi:hypothetical protein